MGNMQVPAQKPYIKIEVLYLVAIFFLLQVFVALLTYTQAFTFDEAMWQYIGRNWLRNGLAPYAGGVDNKSPLIFFVFGLSDKLFGVNYWFPRLIGICFQSSGLYFVYKIARHFSGELSGILAITIYGLSLLWHATGGKYVSYTESYAITFIAAAFYYTVAAKNNWHLFIGGSLAGLGFFFRITAAFGISAIVIYLLLHKKKSVLLFIAAMMISVGVISILLFFSGINLHDVFVYSVEDNFGAGSVTDHPVFWEIDSFFNHVFYSELVLFLPGLVGYFFIKKKNWIIIIWLIAEFAGISLIGVFSNQHFKNVLPALSIINAFSITYLKELYSMHVRPIMIMVWICFFPKILEPVISLKKVIFKSVESKTDYCAGGNKQPDDDSKKMLGLWIKTNTVKDDQVLVAGYGAIVQAYSERLSPCIYFNVTQTQRAKKRFNADIVSNKPKMILVPQSEEYISTVDS
ncbi:MAG TPA: glycosyltransferase family 39 protein, partial [Puia sp.]|nr:glycosyltransferase family 39 protein [Puia sp.]